MRRVYDWPEKLAAALAENAPGEWGKRDCALFACDVVLAMTGTDMAADFRGKYDSPLTAKKLLVAAVGGGLEQLAESMAREHALSEVPVAFAQRGDVCLFDTEEGPTLAVVALDGMHARFPGPTGDRIVPVGECRRAWRIP